MVRITVFGQRAETLSQHLKKGMRVYVEGRLGAWPWTDRTGNVNPGLEVAAQDLESVSQQRGPDFDADQRPARRGRGRGSRR